ncbi:MAG: hypothetical protein ACRD44_06475 [Bryobacteraceae bacterium]
MLKRTRRERAGEPLWKVFPAKKEGIEDGEEGQNGVQERLALYAPLVEIERADTVGILDVEKAALHCELNRNTGEQVRYEIEIRASAGRCLRRAGSSSMRCFWADAGAVKGATPVFGEIGEWTRWVMAFAFIATPGFLLKGALSRSEPVDFRIGSKVAPWAMLVLAVGIALLVAWLRFAHLSTVEVSRYAGGALEQMLSSNGALVFLMLASLSLGFAAYTAYMWDRLDRYVRVQYRLCAIARLRARMKKIELRLSVIEPLKDFARSESREWRRPARRSIATPWR